MSEKLLQAIVKLFAVLAKERITAAERANIQEFLSLHLNQETTGKYLKLFDTFCTEQMQTAEQLDGVSTDDETLEFVGEWALIHEITGQINLALTRQQKVVLIEKIIELFLRDAKFSERQSNLMYHLAELIKIDQKVITELSTFIQMSKSSDFESTNVLIIDSQQLGNAGKHLYNEQLDGFVAILRIPGDEVYFVKYLGENKLFLNGVPFASGPVGILPTGGSIKGDGISPIYYSDVVNQFIQSSSTVKLSFQAENIEYKFKSGHIGLRDVSINEEGGKLIGIMGSSGSGKTTLLNILNGSENPTRGRILINGIDLHTERKRTRGIVGYVPQDDFLIEELTVYENLKYAAQLCFKNMGTAEIEILIKKIMKNLGLGEIRDLRVGSPLDKTISGGQRKRVNIGLELLREPTVLFVDEPTSGLSSRDSENIMDLLKELSLRGKMIFVVIHQPSSDIFKMFDTLLIMDVGGYPIYYGNPVEAVIHFGDTVDMVRTNHGSCPECGNINPEQIFSIIESKVVNEFGRFTDQRKVSPVQWNKIFVEKSNKKKVEASKDALKESNEIPGWFRQFQIFLKRDFFAKLNNTQYVVINILEAPVLALFLALLMRFHQGDNYTYYSNNNIPVFFFVAVIVALFMGLTASAKEIIKDGKILKREQFLNLSRSSYLVSKVAVLFGISAIQTALFVLIACWILEIQNLWLPFWLVMFSVAGVSSMMGLNVSSAFKSAATVYILIPLLLIPQLILSGVVVPFDRFSPTYANREKVPLLGDWIASRWAFEALMVEFYVNNKYERKFFEQEKDESTSRYYNLFYLESMRTKLDNLAQALADDSMNSASSIRDLLIVKNEIRDKLEIFGYDRLPEYEQLEPDQFDSSTYKATNDFLLALQKVLANRRDSGDRVRDSVSALLLENNELDNLRERNHNEELSALVRNTYTSVKILEGKNCLIRKFEPIYYSPVPRHFLDYRTPFYAPTKHLAGSYYRTIYFNIAILWLMVIVLYGTLYFNIPEKVIKTTERLIKW
ncbi:MAG: ATP-binding cassette domain-containing protein [Cytophagales bacterium]|nr:ATP-binding cassette domain-containing protein [Cytophagales bacterium]